MKMILDGQFQGNHLHRLKKITLCFHIDSDEFPYRFLKQLVSSIEKLELCNGFFTEIFCLQSPFVDDTRFPPQPKVLCLNYFPNLISIGLENSWVEPFIGNLEILEVKYCDSLQNLVACTMSFSNMILLKIENCNSMLYLFTSSTAKSLPQLKEMEIKLCDSIEVVVSKKEESESHGDEIVFQQLNCLKLESLPRLRSFYKGSLSFSLLEKLSILNCDWMKTLWYIDLNFTMKSDLNSITRKKIQEKIRVLYIYFLF